MVRGTFANIRLRNLLAPGTEGATTVHLPDGEQMAIYDAAMRYLSEGVLLVVLAGTEYGSGSSRHWAAKGAQPACERCWPSPSSRSTAPPSSAWSPSEGRGFDALVRIDTPMEAADYRHSGILRYVLRQLAQD